MKKLFAVAVLLLLLHGFPSAVYGQDNPTAELAVLPPMPGVLITTPLQPLSLRASGPFFYKGVDYGSASTMSPVSILVNRGFSVIQISERYPRDPRDLTWGSSFDAVMDALTHPDRALDRQGGWMMVFRRHWIPYGVPHQNTNGAWVPNYTGHLVAGGITTRWLAEYFEANDVPHPRLAAAAWYMGTQFLNEVVEQQNETHGNAGTVTDLMFFDPLGVLLFQFDGVAKLFAGPVRSADWSNMASFTFPNFEIQNNGQNMAYKFPVPFTDRVEIVWKLGMGSSLGPSFRLRGGHNVSPTFGFDVSERIIDPATQAESVQLAVRGGLYWDRNDSLMGSVLYVPLYGKNIVTANLYPGALPGPLRHVGFWLTRVRSGGVTFGLASSRTLGLGAGYSGNQ